MNSCDKEGWNWIRNEMRFETAILKLTVAGQNNKIVMALSRYGGRLLFKKFRKQLSRKPSDTENEQLKRNTRHLLRCLLYCSGY